MIARFCVLTLVASFGEAETVRSREADHYSQRYRWIVEQYEPSNCLSTAERLRRRAAVSEPGARR